MNFKTHFQNIVNLNLDYVSTNLIPLIENQYAHTASTEVFDRVKQTVNVLFTEGANGDLVSIWNNLSTDPEVLQAVRDGLNELVTKIEDVTVADNLKLVIEPFVQTLSALTDTVKPDNDQLKEIWNNFFKSPEFIVFALATLSFILDKVIKDEKIRKFINNILSAFITKP